MGRDYFDDIIEIDTYSSRDRGSSLSLYFSSAFVINYDKNHKEEIDVYLGNLRFRLECNQDPAFLIRHPAFLRLLLTWESIMFVRQLHKLSNHWG